MPSTYSPDLRIELIANGEQSGTWGATTNNNLGTLIEDAISGVASQTTNVQKYALLAADGAADQARCAALVLDTTYVGSGNYEVYAPPVTKLYVVKNASSTKDLDLYCGASANSTTVATGGVKYTIPMGKTAFVRSDGTSFFDATNYIAGSVTLTDAVLNTPSLAGEKFSTAATVSAAGTVQANGTALTADYNVVTTVAANSGVVLPDATVGRRIIIVNRGANTLNVYPFAGASQQIDALGANNPITIPVNGVMMFNAATTSRWYSSSTLTLTDSLITTPSLVAAKVSTSASVTAGTNVQGQGALTSDYNVITSAAANPSGVTLPAATVGRKVLIVNKGANPVNVYPATSAAIDAIAANSPISLPVGGLLEFNASSATQWYSSYNATTAASVGGVSFTGTQPTANVAQVPVYGATGSSITTARTYQFRATTGGQAQIQLFENATGGNTDSITIQPPSALTASYTLTLPADDGAASQFLQTNGSGVLSWAAGTADTASANRVWAGPTSGTAAAPSFRALVAADIPKTLSGTGWAVGGTANPSTNTWPLFTSNNTTHPGYVAFNNNSSGTGILCSIGDLNPGNQILFQHSTSSTAGSGTLTQVGAITSTNTGTSYGTTSDRRLKTNIVPLTNAIPQLNLLLPKRYNWKVDPTGRPVEGFIADELQPVIPDAVVGNPDDVNPDGSIRPQQIDMSYIVPLLTAALQEAVTRIEALEAQLAAM